MHGLSFHPHLCFAIPENASRWIQNLESPLWVPAKTGSKGRGSEDLGRSPENVSKWCLTLPQWLVPLLEQLSLQAWSKSKLINALWKLLPLLPSGVSFWQYLQFYKPLPSSWYNDCYQNFQTWRWMWISFWCSSCSSPTPLRAPPRNIVLTRLSPPPSTLSGCNPSLTRWKILSKWTRWARH